MALPFLMPCESMGCSGASVGSEQGINRTEAIASVSPHYKFSWFVETAGLR